jgi:hypothetical protein
MVRKLRETRFLARVSKLYVLMHDFEKREASTFLYSVYWIIRSLAEVCHQVIAITAHVHVRTTGLPIDKVQLNTLINRVQFENHGPARLGPRIVPAIPHRLIKGVELRFPNWMRFRHAAGAGSWDYALQAVQQEKPSTAPLRVGACLYKPLWAGPQPS